MNRQSSDEIQNMKAGFKAELDAVNEKKMRELGSKLSNVEPHLKNQDREIRKRNLVIFGVDSKNNTIGELETTVCDLIQEKLGIPLNRADIDFIRRAGNNEPTKKNPIIMGLVKFSLKLQILENIQKLRGSGVYIRNDCTKEDGGMRRSFGRPVTKSKDKILCDRPKASRRSQENANASKNILQVPKLSDNPTDDPESKPTDDPVPKLLVYPKLSLNEKRISPPKEDADPEKIIYSKILGARKPKNNLTTIKFGSHSKQNFSVQNTTKLAKTLVSAVKSPTAKEESVSKTVAFQSTNIEAGPSSSQGHNGPRTPPKMTVTLVPVETNNDAQINAFKPHNIRRPPVIAKRGPRPQYKYGTQSRSQNHSSY